MQSESRAVEAPRKFSSTIGTMIWVGGFALFIVGIIGLVVGARLAGLIGYYSIPTNSMAPAVPEHAHVLVERFSYLLGTPQRGDIVLYNNNGFLGQAGEKFLKRIVGMPGDILEWKPDQLLINSKAPSDYLPTLQCFDRLPYVPNLRYLSFDQSRFDVPAGEYFLLGDNVRNSLDSRFLGPVLKPAIVGKVLFIFK